jgi:hypothetical protein
MGRPVSSPPALPRFAAVGNFGYQAVKLTLNDSKPISALLVFTCLFNGFHKICNNGQSCASCTEVPVSLKEKNSEAFNKMR